MYGIVKSFDVKADFHEANCSANSRRTGVEFAQLVPSDFTAIRSEFSRSRIASYCFAAKCAKRRMNDQWHHVAAANLTVLRQLRHFLDKMRAFCQQSLEYNSKERKRKPRDR